MFYVWSLLVLGISYAVGTFGFCQIIGSFQQARVRGPGMTAFTVILWAAILIAVCFVVHRWFLAYRIAYYIGTALSLLMSLRAGKIE